MKCPRHPLLAREVVEVLYCAAFGADCALDVLSRSLTRVAGVLGRDFSGDAALLSADASRAASAVKETWEGQRHFAHVTKGVRTAVPIANGLVHEGKLINLLFPSNVEPHANVVFSWRKISPVLDSTHAAKILVPCFVVG